MLVRYLETAVGAADDQGQTVIGVEDVFEITEAVNLRRMIVQWIGAAVRGFDTQIVTQQVGGHEIVEVAGTAAVFECRLERAVAAAVERDRPARLEQAALGG